MFWVACVAFFLLTTAQAMIKGFKVAFSAGGMNFMWQILRRTQGHPEVGPDGCWAQVDLRLLEAPRMILRSLDALRK